MRAAKRFNMNGSHEKYTVKILRFGGTRYDDFQFLCLRMRATLKMKIIARTISFHEARAEGSDEALYFNDKSIG